MKAFYHFSHFFEILTGIYFGGFALLGFLQKGAATSIHTKMQRRRDESRKAQISFKEYFKIRIQSSPEFTFSYIISTFLLLITFVIILLIKNLLGIFFSLSNKQIETLSPEMANEIVLKKFFPSFFFAGCFCLILILFSAFQNECTDFNCSQGINFFILYYFISALIFHIWSLFIFPHIVNKLDYVHLILINIIICSVLTYFTIKYSNLSHLKWHLDWFLSEANKSWLIFWVLLTCLFPLLYILTKTVLVIVAWEIPIIFNIIMFKMFNIRTVLEEDISELGPIDQS